MKFGPHDSQSGWAVVVTTDRYTASSASAVVTEMKLKMFSTFCFAGLIEVMDAEFDE